MRRSARRGEAVAQDDTGSRAGLSAKVARVTGAWPNSPVQAGSAHEQNRPITGQRFLYQFRFRPRGRGCSPAARTAAFHVPNVRITVTRQGLFGPARSHSSCVGAQRYWRCQRSMAYAIVSRVHLNPALGPGPTTESVAKGDTAELVDSSRFVSKRLVRTLSDHRAPMKGGDAHILVRWHRARRSSACSMRSHQSRRGSCLLPE